MLGRFVRENGVLLFVLYVCIFSGADVRKGMAHIQKRPAVFADSRVVIPLFQKKEFKNCLCAGSLALHSVANWYRKTQYLNLILTPKR